MSRPVCGVRWPGACQSSCRVCTHGPDHACVRPPRHPARCACWCGAVRAVCGARWPGVAASESVGVRCAHGPDHACVRAPRHPDGCACWCGAETGGWPPGSLAGQIGDVGAAVRGLTVALAGLWRLWLVVYAAACVTVIALLAAGVR